jgi:hypothetical protein
MNHEVAIHECTRCKHMKHMNYYTGVLDCGYDEEDRVTEKINPKIKVTHKDECNFADDRNFIGDLITNH